MNPLSQDTRQDLEALYHLLSTDCEVLELLAAPKYLKLTARLALILRDAGSLMIDDQSASKAEILLEQSRLPPATALLRNHTSTAVSLDGGLHWSGMNNDVRLNYREAEENDDMSLDMILVATHEGVVLDLVRQDDGTVARTASIPLSDLVAMTR